MRFYTCVIAVFICLLPPAMASAQSGTFDPQGHLTRMPFEPSVPVTRTETRGAGEDIEFINYSSMRYEQVVEHYRRAYQRQTELAPGWTIMGYGFNVPPDAFQFTLAYREQIYRMMVRPDGSGSVLTVRARGTGLGYQPHLHTAAPYRPSDLPAMPVDNLR